MTTPTEKDAMALAVLSRTKDRLAKLMEDDGGLGEARAHLASRIAELEAENERAWAAANRADAKVRGWEATMVCTGLPFRACSVDGWGPGADGTVEVPQPTTEKLTSILDRLARAEADLAAVREDGARLNWLDAQGYSYGFEDLIEGNCWELTGPYMNLRAAIDAVRGGE